MASPDVPVEIIFAQHLAANEKVHRDRALRKLQKYIHNRSSLPNGGFNETELLKIWKGLHYCMWMQDKPLIQEELSANVARLIHSFNNRHTALLFIRTFYITECREWLSIDKWRMDKFLMMFRNMLTESFEFIKKHNWSEKLITDYLKFLLDYIISDDDHIHTPDGVKFHLVDTYLTELEAVSKGKLGPKQTVAFIQPWITMLITVKSLSLRAHVIKNVFGELLQRSPVLSRASRSKDSATLRVHYNLVADKLLEAGSSEKCTTVNRPVIYNLVQNYRDVHEGKLPFNPEDQKREEVKDLDEDDMKAALERLAAFDEEMREENAKGKKQKKRKRELADVDEAYGSGSSQEEEQTIPTLTPTKKLKVAKKKSKEIDAEGNKPQVLSKRLKKIIQLEEEIAHRDDESDQEEFPADVSDADTKNQKDHLDACSAQNEASEDSANKTNIGVEKLEKATKKKRSRVKKRKSVVSEIEDDVSAINHPSVIEPTGLLKGDKAKQAPQTEEVDTDLTAQKKTKDGRKSNKTKIQKQKTPDFEVADFSDSEDLYTDAHLDEASVQSTIRSMKKNSSEVTKCKKQKKRAKNATPTAQPLTATTHATPPPASMKKKAASTPQLDVSAKLAKFSTEGVTKAKYMKKAMSKSLPNSPLTPAKKKPGAAEEKRRISFGKSCSVKKTEVKLKGSRSHDPTRTPEQSILKVNPIKPGTVIQVGKQATLRNTLKNSKFPHRMMASDFY